MPELPASVVRRYRSRQSLLWVCQRYDLRLGKEPHSLDLPPSEASLRYRAEILPSDESLVSLYWEAMWLEGAKSPLLTSLRKYTSNAVQPRQLILLASQTDATALVSSNAFLAVCVLPGILDTNTGPDSAFGATRGRVRERVSWSLVERLQEFPRRVLTVVGAESETDLEQLFQALEDLRTIDLEIVIVSNQEFPLTSVPGRPDIKIYSFPSSIEDFAKYLKQAGGPSSEHLPAWTIRIGSQAITLDVGSLGRILERFSLLTEQDLARPSQFSVEDFTDFLEGRIDNWKAFGAGLPVPRPYRTGPQHWPLQSEVLDALRRASDPRLDTPTITLQLPVEGGSGATTLLRHCAYRAAEEGYPALVLRQAQIDVEPDQLLAFATAVNEICAKIRVEVPAMLIVTDIEHSAIPGIRQLPQVLAARFRKAVILQALPAEVGETFEEIRTKRTISLRPLSSELAEADIRACADSFASLDREWGLGLDLPTGEEWSAYERSTLDWKGSRQQSSQLFWVALRFFLTERMPLETKGRFESALGGWIEKRFSKVSNERMFSLATFIACFSSFRLPSPLWTVMRPVTSGSFSSEVVTLLRELDDIVSWSDRVEEFEDQSVRFRHPALADEFLRRSNIITTQEKVAALSPVFEQLSAGQPGDSWIIDIFVASVIAPRFGEAKLSQQDWAWRLSFLETLPLQIRETSKTILHHWARCLYLSSDFEQLTQEERRRRIEQAISKLQIAIALPRKPSRDELPSHLYNTLGTAYSRLADLYDAESSTKEATRAWAKACIAFREAIDAGWGGNLDTLLGFSDRLLRRAELHLSRGNAHIAANDVATALALLDEADQLLSDSVGIDPRKEETVIKLRHRAFVILGSGLAEQLIKDLQQDTGTDLGFYCEAQVMAERGFPDGALAILEQAEGEGVRLEARSLRLKIRLLKLNAIQKFEFEGLRNVYQDLEKDPDYRFRPIDSFEHAVLCYQTGAYDEGSRRFRQLREKMRALGNAPPRTRDIWRNSTDPTSPRTTNIRVTRMFSELRGEGFVEDLGQTIPFTPRQFSEIPKINEIVPCAVRFGFNGPLAIPLRLAERN